ncbi:MAG TPA: TIM barrel protein [Pseudonocardia sp.]|nr:TIM barrel protein [Pseudonocardia sp.]
MPGHPLSLAAGTVLDLDPAGTVECAAEAGYPLVGVRLGDARAQGPAVAAALCRTGVGLLDVEVARVGPGPLRDAHRRLADTATALGARYLVTVSTDPDEQATRAKLAELAELTAGGDTRIALEPMAFTAVRRLADAARIAAAVPRCTVLADPLHLHRSGDGTAATTALDPRLVGYAQLCDVADAATAPADLAHEARHERLPPGHGTLPLCRFLAGLPPGCPLGVEVQSDRLAALEPAARAVLVRRAAGAVLERAGGRT